MKTVIGAMILILAGCGEPPATKEAPISDNSGGPSGQQSTENLRCDLEFKKVSLCAQMTWVKGPQWDANKEEPMEVKLDFWDTQTKTRATLNYDFAFDSAMPTMNNHPLATRPSVSRDASAVGVYSVSDIRISCLGGNWHFFFQLKSGGQVVDQVRYVWVRDDHLIN